jgi:hypothetical protein
MFFLAMSLSAITQRLRPALREHSETIDVVMADDQAVTLVEARTAALSMVL